MKGDKAQICDFQNSSMLRDFVEGNGLIYMNDKIENRNKEIDLIVTYYCKDSW